MASKKKKAASAGSSAVAAGLAARENPYVKRLVEDGDLRDELLSAYESARKVYDRASDKGPGKVLEDKKLQNELKSAADSLKSVADSLREPAKKKRKRRPGRVLLVAVVGAGLALALSEGLRKKVLDGLFGAEEEFEYTSSTTPASSSNGTPAASETVGA